MFLLRILIIVILCKLVIWKNWFSFAVAFQFKSWPTHSHLISMHPKRHFDMYFSIMNNKLISLLNFSSKYEKQLIFKSKSSLYIVFNYSKINARNWIILKYSHECIKQLIRPRKYKTTKTMYPKPQPTMY